MSGCDHCRAMCMCRVIYSIFPEHQLLFSADACVDNMLTRHGQHQLAVRCVHSHQAARSSRSYKLPWRKMQESDIIVTVRLDATKGELSCFLNGHLVTTLRNGIRGHALSLVASVKFAGQSVNVV